MAATLQNRGLASLGKQVVRLIRTRDSVVAPLLSLRKGVHVSAYDKNPDEHVFHPSIVPDEIIPSQRGQYWAPHPQTGVFGPAADHNLPPSALHLSSASAESVLEQKAFFRSLEDLEKPVQH